MTLFNIVPKVGTLVATAATAAMNAMDKGMIDDKCGRSSSSAEFAKETAASFNGDILGTKVYIATHDRASVKYTFSYETTETTDISESSSATFHLSDPDFGDYFVVSVWSGTCREPLNYRLMAVNSISSARLHVRPMGRTCR